MFPIVTIDAAFAGMRLADGWETIPVLSTLALSHRDAQQSCNVTEWD
jgi:hypothetical protein